MKKRYISMIMLAASLTITSCAGSNGAESQAAPTEVSMAESEASTNAAGAAENSSASDASVTVKSPISSYIIVAAVIESDSERR